MKHYTRSLFSLVCLSLLTFQGCYYDVEEELYPSSGSICDTNSVTYSQSIAPVISNSCLGCHSTGSSQGGVTLDSRASIIATTDSGKRLLGSIRWDAGFAPMPQGGNKLNDCTIMQIATWVHAGLPDN